MTTLDDVIRNLTARGYAERHRQFSPLKAPPYRPSEANLSPQAHEVGLAVESMKNHTTDEGWQLFKGLEGAGYFLEGGKVPGSGHTNIPFIVGKHMPVKTIVVQDKREWEGKTAGAGFDSSEGFQVAGFLSSLSGTFRLTVLKDAHQDPGYHRDSAVEIGAHAWVTYYHPAIVSFVAPYVRLRHLVRTCHSLDPALVQEYRPDGRSGAVLSGAVSAAYPLRERIVRSLRAFPSVDHLKHPGYRRDGCLTAKYLETLSHYKVAICTSSVYGYALRKIIEATAAGCVVITDLPSEDRLPVIDGNLIRVSNGIGIGTLNGSIEKALREYDSDRQRVYSEAAKTWYDYRAVGRRLAVDIEDTRRTYL